MKYILIGIKKHNQRIRNKWEKNIILTSFKPISKDDIEFYKQFLNYYDSLRIYIEIEKITRG